MDIGSGIVAYRNISTDDDFIDRFIDDPNRIDEMTYSSIN